MVGFALGGGGTNWSMAQGLGGGRSDVFQVGLYGTKQFGEAYVARRAVLCLARRHHRPQCDDFRHR